MHPLLALPLYKHLISQIGFNAFSMSYNGRENIAKLTPQRGTEAVPAWGPPNETKFLTCSIKGTKMSVKDTEVQEISNIKWLNNNKQYMATYEWEVGVTIMKILKVTRRKLHPDFKISLEKKEKMLCKNTETQNIEVKVRKTSRLVFWTLDLWRETTNKPNVSLIFLFPFSSRNPNRAPTPSVN